MFVMSQRNGGISISFTTQSSPQRSEIVRDVTEKRLLHRFLPRHRAQIDCGHGPPSSQTDTSLLLAPNASVARKYGSFQPQRRILFVMSQRNVCYFVFSPRHTAQSIADMVLPAPDGYILTVGAKCCRGGEVLFHQSFSDA